MMCTEHYFAYFLYKKKNDKRELCHIYMPHNFLSDENVFLKQNKGKLFTKIKFKNYEL